MRVTKCVSLTKSRLDSSTTRSTRPRSRMATGSRHIFRLDEMPNAVPTRSHQSSSIPLPSSASPIQPVVSLLSARRPSWTPSFDLPVRANQSPSRLREATGAELTPSSSPETGGNFQQSLQIDMKSLVGDAVGNVEYTINICCCMLNQLLR